MMPSANLNTNINIKLPLSFIIYALVALVIGQLILFLNTDLLLAWHFRIPIIWMAGHFLLLGFAVMVVMGAMYQLVPVAFLTPIWNQTFGYIQFAVTAVGVAVFAYLLGVKPVYAIYGGVIVIIGILMFIFQMTMTILKQKNKNMMTYFVLGALICFVLTILAGFLLVWNIAFGMIDVHNTILYSHITLGVAGWFTLLIFGFSYKLVPMFSLSHGFSMKWAKPAFIVYVLGLIILISSFWTYSHVLQMLGWITLFIGYSFFALDVREILSKRMRKKLDKPFSFALLAIKNGHGIHFLALIASVLGVEAPIIWSWLIFLYIMGWIIFSILGYLYKIVPFLWWTHKYSEKIGREKTPTLKEMTSEKLSVVLFTLFIVGLLGLSIGALLQLAFVLIVFQGLLLLTSIVYTISIFRILMV